MLDEEGLEALLALLGSYRLVAQTFGRLGGEVLDELPRAVQGRIRFGPAGMSKRHQSHGGQARQELPSCYH